MPATKKELAEQQEPVPDEIEDEESGEEDEVEEEEEDSSSELSEAELERRSRYLLDCDPKVAKENDVDESTKRFKYLLGLTDLFRYFIDINMSKDAHFKKFIKLIDGQINYKQPKKKLKSNRRKTEKEEDAELLEEEENMDDDERRTVLTESPSYIQGGQLKEYQIQGLNWLISLYENKLSGILADEMGLGKTLQTIAFLGYLRYLRNIDGPFIIIVPKSTLDNWRREFQKWTPEVNVLVLQGNKEERHKIIREKMLKAKFDVLITSFEMVIREKGQLKKFRWQYIVVDEAHRIKNESSSLSQIIRLFYSKHRLLITGTPLQNNLHELWALLNFLLPDVFGDSNVFDEWFSSQADDGDEKNQDKVVQQLHKVLSPFLLRRVKSDVEKSLLPKIETNVYIGMTNMQIQWYKKLLEKDIDAVNGVVGKREGKTRLLNIVMQLRKCCNHPYLFDGAEPGPPFTTDEHLVFNAGKMIILDKMLKKFKAAGSRVLIFSQMSRLLDILEDYCYFRDYEYCRIDGSTAHEDRIEAIDDYNAPDLDKFIFLLTTRAGGLGINLTSADVVILYDSDWNPQADLQAMDRAHRIGQTKQVQVFRFVTEHAIEEKVLERAAQKLRLDQLVIQQGRQSTSSNIGNTTDDLLGMIQHGAKEVFESKLSSSMLDDDVDAILARGKEKTANLNAKFNKLGLDDLQNFTSDASVYEWNGENFAKPQSERFGLSWINPSKRERKEQTYSVDNYYKEMLKAGSGKPSLSVKIKQPKVYHPQDHQFFSPELKDLLEREQLSYKKATNYQYSLDDFGDSDEEFLNGDEDEAQREEKLAIEQKRIADVVPLSEEEQKLRDELLEQSFSDWSRRDFTNFIHASARYGRENHRQIAKSLGRDLDEIERYCKTFWSNYQSIEGYEKYIAQIESSEKKTAKMLNQQKILAMKIEEAEDPLEELKIQYPPNNSKKIYSKLEDRFILYCVYKHGIFAEKLGERIKEEILRSDLFKFDFYMASRTPQELSRRVNTLMLALSRDGENTSGRKRGRQGAGRSGSARAGSVDPSWDNVSQETTPGMINGSKKSPLATDENTSNKKIKIESSA